MRRPALLALLGLLALAPAAAAYHVNAPAWPRHRITYANGYPGNPLVIARAVRAWNASGVAVRFVRASSPATAQLRILGYRSGCQGFAVRSGARAVVRLSRGGCRGPDEMARVAAHELGHVLGLGHEDRFCATMNSKDHDRCSLPRHPWQWRCRLLEPDDVRGARRIYGGVDLFIGSPFCDRFPAVGPPRRLAARFDPARGIVVTWRNVADPHLANLSGAVGATCPVRRPLDPDFALPAAVIPGRPGSLVLSPPGPGPACVSLWSEDVYGRLGPPARVPVTVPGTPPGVP